MRVLIEKAQQLINSWFAEKLRLFRELWILKKLRLLKKPWILNKLRLLKLRLLEKPYMVILSILFILLLLFTGIFALTRKSPDDTVRDHAVSDGSVRDHAVRDGSDQDHALSDDLFSGFQDGEEPPPEWIPPGPPRWFRSNAGGMTLEENPSRIAALRNKYALVIDYVPPDEVDPRLLPFYQEGYTVEIRVLYESRKEYRRQWLFRDEAGIARLNAVFKPRPDRAPDSLPGEAQAGIQEIIPKEIFEHDYFIDDESYNSESAADAPAAETPVAEAPVTDAPAAETPVAEAPVTETPAAEIPAAEIPIAETPIAEGSPEIASPEIAHEAMPDPDLSGLISGNETVKSIGFIEIFNEKARIIEDHWLYEDNSEMVISYFYYNNTLIKAETGKKTAVLPPNETAYYDAVLHPMYTDTYRYNRSSSLRYVERLYHQKVEVEPVRLVFPGRILEAAADRSFMRDKLALRSDFLENFSVEENYRIIYDTDSRGRILTQTMIDSKNETVWVIKNTWSGNRIVAMQKTEGEDTKLVEYEYDREGNQIVQRDINNGVLERQVYTQGDNETEELYLNGVVVLRAYWEKGRKVKEEQVRR